jgi:hypothetical protein
MDYLRRHTTLMEKIVLWHRWDMTPADRVACMIRIVEVKESKSMTVGEKIRELNAVARELRMTGVDYARMIEGLVAVQAIRREREEEALAAPQVTWWC